MVNGEHVTDPVKIEDAFNEYFTSINATTALPDHQNLATSQSELDTLLQDFVNSHIDDIIRIRKLCMLHKIIQGHCPAYFNNYIECICNTHNYNTRSVSNNNITTPACKISVALERFIQALAVYGTLLMPNLGYFPILILKITYLNFTVVGILLLIILRFVKRFS